MSTIKEFANQEFEEFVHKNDLEVFSKSQVNQFVTDAQSVEDEFEKHCIAVDLVSLTKGIVINDDLTKSIVYYRPSQVEPIEGDQEFGSILKSKNLQYKDTPINRIKGIVGLPVNKDIIEKARKAEPIGTEKTYGGKLYIKTEKGWRPKSKKSQGATESSKEKDDSSNTKTAEEIIKEMNFIKNEISAIEGSKGGRGMFSKVEQKQLDKAKQRFKELDNVLKEKHNTSYYEHKELFSGIKNPIEKLKAQTLKQLNDVFDDEPEDKIVDKKIKVGDKEITVRRELDTTGGQKTKVYSAPGLFNTKMWNKTEFADKLASQGDAI